VVSDDAGDTTALFRRGYLAVKMGISEINAPDVAKANDGV